jgi:hypothetical protein
MSRGWIILASVLAMTTVSAQLPDAQPPIVSSRAELVVVHATVRDRQGGYVTALPNDGQFRRIRVVVDDPARRSLRVRARDGYRAANQSERR